AGGLLWRDISRSSQIALVHRYRYDDWTLPKGKLKENEAWSEGALREVKEETGYDARLIGFAGAIAYTTDKGLKIVRFWNMVAYGEPKATIDNMEVAEVQWLPIEAARSRVQYPLERALLDVWQSSQELR